MFRRQNVQADQIAILFGFADAEFPRTRITSLKNFAVWPGGIFNDQM